MKFINIKNLGLISSLFLIEQAYSRSYLFCVDENNTNARKWAPPNSVTYE